jgi:hypothetical protein
MVQWGNSTLNAQVNLTGLAANTSTQGFVVPGTCANPGGIATFRTKAVTSDGNGNVSGSGTKVGMQRSGIRLPKAFEVVQNGQIVLCGDTNQNPSTANTSGLAASGSVNITMNPASGPGPSQAHTTNYTSGGSRTVVTGPNGQCEYVLVYNSQGVATRAACSSS